MISLRDIHWDILLVQDLELWEVLLMVAPLMDSQVVTEISNFRYLDLENHREKDLDLHWNIILIQYLELWEVLEVLLMADKNDNFLQRYLRRVHQRRWAWMKDQSQWVWMRWQW